MTVAEDGVRRAGRRSEEARTAVVWRALAPVLSSGPLDVVDVGGGTGKFAVPLAELGHRVTVVDPNPDALAALERRSDEAGVTVRSVQADASALESTLGGGCADLVLCHSVLEYVDRPAAAMASIFSAMRPGGHVSVIVAGVLAAALHRAVAGHVEDAHRVLTREDGRWGDRDPVPHRFTSAALAALAQEAGLVDIELHGVRVFADLVSSAIVDADPKVAEALLALEATASTHPVLADLATQLHIRARRPS